MGLPHYPAMVAGYVTALVLWSCLARWSAGRPGDLWPRRPIRMFARPWLELALVFVAGSAVIGIGQLYSAGLLVPETGRWAVIGATINQALIFAPMPLLMVIRRQGPLTAWLPMNRVWARLGVGMGLVCVVLLVYWGLRRGLPLWAELALMVEPRSLDEAVQVFLEDLTIAMLMVRLIAALNSRVAAAGLTGALFAAGHIPAMISGGAIGPEAARLLLDAGLGFGVVFVLHRAGDLWWFWCVHYTLDMMQFVQWPPA